MTLGTCAYCARQWKLDPRGCLAVHMLRIDVSRRAVRTVGAGRVRCCCPGSGRPAHPARRPAGRSILALVNGGRLHGSAR